MTSILFFLHPSRIPCQVCFISFLMFWLYVSHITSASSRGLRCILGKNLDSPFKSSLGSLSSHIIIIIIIIKEHKWTTKKKKTQWNDEQYILKKPKSTVAFTHSHNKYYNIFIKHLFSAVVDHNLIFYYFISIYKKLKPQ